MSILNENQEFVLKDERRILGDLRVSLVRFDVDETDLQAFGESISQLDDLFLLVVVGEFNAGKTALINALLGDRYLSEGVTPTTTQINVLRYGDQFERVQINENQLLLKVPSNWLADISIVDTPGTNAIVRSHEAITTEFVPRSDIVLFVTSADRPFTESERVFLDQIRGWGKKIIFVLNKIDILQNDDETSQVVRFVEENAQSMLGISSEIFPLSAKLAMRAILGEKELWGQSKFQALQDYISNTLDERNRVQLKLLNPLGVGLHLSEKILQTVLIRLETLKVDSRMLDDVDAQLGIYQQDMRRDFSYRMADIENSLYEMETRGIDFFDQTFRLTHVSELLSKERIRKSFEEKVIDGVPQDIEKKVLELIDWLVDSDLRQWQAVNQHLMDRRRAYQDRIVGDMGLGTFNYERDRIMEGVGKETQQVLESYDKSEEARKIAENAQEAVAASAVLEVGAIGLGALVTILATTVAADVTGILMATFIAALGLIIIPARRKAAKKEIRAKIFELRTQLIETLDDHFTHEIERSVTHIQEAIGPYTRFVRAEQGKLTDMKTSLESFITELKRLKSRIQEL